MIFFENGEFYGNSNGQFYYVFFMGNLNFYVADDFYKIYVGC